MTTALNEDVERLRSVFSSGDAELEVTLRLARESAQKVLALLDAEQGAGAVVIPAKQEYTTTQAATLLSMSRPTLMKLIHSGRVDYRKVGKHHRIPASAVESVLEELTEDHMAAIADVSNRYGNID